MERSQGWRTAQLLREFRRGTRAEQADILRLVRRIGVAQAPGTLSGREALLLKYFREASHDEQRAILDHVGARVPQ